MQVNMIASAQFDGIQLWDSYQSSINEQNLFFRFMSESVKWGLVSENGLFNEDLVKNKFNKNLIENFD